MKKVNSLWIYFIMLSPKIQTSTFSILKQFGAHTVILPIQEIPASMLTIGKITEENLIFMSMIKNNALTGK